VITHDASDAARAQKLKVQEAGDAEADDHGRLSWEDGHE